MNCLITLFFKVDIAYIPFIERFQTVLNELFKCDITAERPKLSAWIEVYMQSPLSQKRLHLSSLGIRIKAIGVMFAGNEQD